MGYFGSKATSGLCQALIALMPPHSVYIESHLGGGALMKRKPTGVRSIGIDRDAQALEAFACDYPVRVGAWLCPCLFGLVPVSGPGAGLQRSPLSAHDPPFGTALSASTTRRSTMSRSWTCSRICPAR